MDRVVGGKYKLGRKLGSGSFGELFLGNVIWSFFCLLVIPSFAFVITLLFSGVNVQTGEEVAVKLVSLNIWLLPFSIQ